MKRERIISRSGAATLRADGVFLHSRYDPLREAQRHLDSLDISGRAPRNVVVIGEGIPYLSEVIASRHPHISVFAAILGEVSEEARFPQIDVTTLETGQLRRWLRKHLSPLDAAAVELVTWEPGRRVAPDLVAQAERETLEVVQNASAEIATIGSFGRRWLANAVRTALLVDRRWDILQPLHTATLATSGPSLERIVTGGRAVFPGLLAVTSSAWPTLAKFDITPDVVVHTDGGYWATRYLRSRTENGDRDAPVVAMSAPAAVPEALLRSPTGQRVSFLSTGWLGEALHIDREQWRRVPEAPTVAATALHLLHELLPQGQIFLAGLDMMSRGLQGHARPHPNDRFIAMAAHRLRPEISVRAERTLGPKVTMQRWPDGVVGYRSPALEAFLPEIQRILAHHRSSGGVSPLSPADGRGRTETERPRLRSYRRPAQAERIAHARHVIDTWRSAARDGSWDREQRDILFHLAPVEVLQALRGARDARTVVASAQTSLDALSQLVDRISQ